MNSKHKKLEFHGGNIMKRLDCSMIRTLRVPHQQFEAIKNKAKYLEIVDKDKGDVITFVLEKTDSQTEVTLKDIAARLGSIK